MRDFPSLLGKFLKEHPLNTTSLIRLLGSLGISALSGIAVIYYNNDTYWNVTIDRVQTVDFNILANLLPSKLSRQLLTNDSKGLQETIDSNYGLFGMVVTDCKSAETSCPQQKIIYLSKAEARILPDGKQKIELKKAKYPPTWADKLVQTDYPAQQLTGDFLILRDPPPFKQEWKFDNPRASEKTLTGEQNTGNIIGRVYLLRGTKPSFQSEVKAWLENPLNNSSKNVVYNAIAGSAILTGFIVWLLTELLSYIKISADRQELEAKNKVSEAAKMKFKAEQKLRQATDKISQAAEQLSLATQAAAEARNFAGKAQAYADFILNLESTTQQEKIDAQNQSYEANARAELIEKDRQLLIEDKQQLEADKQILEQRAVEAEKKLEATEADKQYLFGEIGAENNEAIEKLSSENNNLKKENDDLRDKLEQEVKRHDLTKEENIQIESINNDNKKHKLFINAYEVLILADEIFPTLQIFESAMDSSKSGNGGLDYEPDKVLKALAILVDAGNDYFTGKPGNNFHKILEQRGVKSSDESYTVKNKKNSRRFGNIDMYTHLKIGELRIHYYLDRESKKIQIGYCGKHLN
jgi:hypothetical protein